MVAGKGTIRGSNRQRNPTVKRGKVRHRLNKILKSCTRRIWRDKQRSNGIGSHFRIQAWIERLEGTGLGALLAVKLQDSAVVVFEEAVIKFRRHGIDWTNLRLHYQ